MSKDHARFKRKERIVKSPSKLGQPEKCPSLAVNSTTPSRASATLPRRLDSDSSSSSSPELIGFCKLFGFCKILILFANPIFQKRNAIAKTVVEWSVRSAFSSAKTCI